MKINGFKVGGRTFKPRKRDIESIFKYLEKQIINNKE